MPRIIAKFGYMQPSNKRKSSFLIYIATRDGVIKNLEKNKDNPVTQKQENLIEKLLVKFPNFINSSTYKMYVVNKTLGSASELITEIEEEHYQELSQASEYVEYIAQRPRVVKEQSHGLFTSHDDPIILSKVKSKLSNHKGNVWTAIISLKREDAHRLQYEDLKSWKILVRALQNNLAENLQIDYDQFEWYGAFHNEAHHPHIHLMMFSNDERQGYLNQKSIDNIRGAFAREIFKHDLLNIYQKQTQYRDQLKLSSETFIKAQIDEIRDIFKPNKEIELRLIDLAKVLSTTKGKHTYGYLPKPTKKMVDEIVNLVSHQPEVQELLSLWYEQRQEVLYTYTDKKEKIKNLADIDAFRSIKNMIVKEAKTIDLNETKIIQKKIDILESYPSVIHFDDSEELVELSIQNNTVYLPASLDLETFSLEEKEWKEMKEEHKEIIFKYNPTLLADKQFNQGIVFNSVKLLYSISNMFEHSMNQTAQKHHADRELLKQIRKQKIALGQKKE